jgi:CRISPR system Cascade subunit CasA
MDGGSSSDRRLRSLAAIAATLVVSSCAHYSPAPPHPETFPAAFDERSLEQPPAGGAWREEDLLRAALARNPAVAEAAAKYAEALAAARAARSAPNISLTLTVEYARERHPWGHAAATDIPLDLGARRSTRVSTADLQALQAFYDYQEAAWDVRTALAKAVGELAGADQVIGWAEKIAALRQERVARLELRTAAGEDDRFLAYAARNDLIAAETRVHEARARRDQARAALAKAVGVPATSLLELKVAPPPAPPPGFDLVGWRRDAALSRRDVFRALADYDIAENALRLEVAKQYPDIRIGPGYYWDHGVLKLPFNLALTLPPTDLNRANIRKAEAARTAAGRSLETVQANALAAVDHAALGLQAARVARDLAREEHLPAARRAAEAAGLMLRLGEGDRVDELAAHAAEAEAEFAVLDAERAYRLAAIDLEDALRRPFDPAEAAVLDGDARGALQ